VARMTGVKMCSMSKTNRMLFWVLRPDLGIEGVGVSSKCRRMTDLPGLMSALLLIADYDL